MIYNLHDLSNTITAVANRVLEVVTNETSSGQYYVDYNDVADLISHEDYLQHFQLIANELQGREEVLDLDCSEHEFDVTCGLAWCKNYEPLSEESFIKGLDYASEDLCQKPSMTRLAQLGQKAIEQIILHNGKATLTPELLELKPDELAYICSITGYPQPECVKLGTMPVTNDSFENLLLTAELQREQLKYDKTASATPLAFDMCVNAHGQMDDEMLADHPAAKTAFEQLFHWTDPACDYRYGALISGKPAIVLDYDLRLSVREGEPDDFNFRHAVAAMVAAQLQQIFFGTNARITYGHSLGANDGGDIVAIIPADADPKLVRDFDLTFALALHDIPFSHNRTQLKKQYDTVVARIHEELPKNTIVTPWTQANPEFAVSAAFASFGSRIGQENGEWRQALATHNTAKQARIANTFDLTKIEHDEDGFDLLSTIVRDGIHAADAYLSQRLRLYTNTEPGKEQSFTAPKGQIISAMKEMGYQGEDIYPSLIGYSKEMAVEIKSLVEQMPRLSLSQQLRYAQERKARNELRNAVPPREEDRGRDD